MIRKYDIICLVETKTDDIDIVKLEGYEIHMKNRKIVAKNRSGGIILGYRQEIASKIKPLHTNSKYVFWFKVSSDLVNLDQDIIFGIVYIPPENTVYSSQDAFREIENEYNNFSINYKYISLIGDFNGRTADEDDFFFSSENHGYDAARYIENDVLTLDELHIPRKRSSSDPIKKRVWQKTFRFL
jgi:hypothetical protein